MKYKPSDANNILELLSGSVREGVENEGKSLDAFAILSLPRHLRKTALAIHKLAKATSEMTCKITGRSMEAEEGNLVELTEMGYLKQGEQGLDTYYYLTT